MLRASLSNGTVAIENLPGQGSIATRDRITGDLLAQTGTSGEFPAGVGIDVICDVIAQGAFRDDMNAISRGSCVWILNGDCLKRATTHLIEPVGEVDYVCCPIKLDLVGVGILNKYVCQAFGHFHLAWAIVVGNELDGIAFEIQTQPTGGIEG